MASSASTLSPAAESAAFQNFRIDVRLPKFPKSCPIVSLKIMITLHYEMGSNLNAFHREHENSSGHGVRSVP